MIWSRKFWLGVVVSTAFLVLLLTRVNLSELWSALVDANYVYVIPGIAIYFVAVVFRTLRWRYLLHPLGEFPVRRLYPVVVIGYMANNLLPMRLGELVRAYYIGEREKISKTASLATIAVERVMDGITLLFFMAVVSLFIPLSGFFQALQERTNITGWLLLLGMAGPFVAAVVMLVVLAYVPKTARKWLRRFLRLAPGRFRSSGEALAGLFLEGLKALRDPGKLLAISLLSALVWLSEGAMYYVIAFSFGLHELVGGLGALVGALLLATAISNLATSLPSSQGGVGPFEFFAAVTLLFFGVGVATASAYVLVLHAALLIPVTLLGLLFMGMQNMSLKELWHQREARTAGSFPALEVTLKGDEKL